MIKYASQKVKKFGVKEMEVSSEDFDALRYKQVDIEE
jgi:hypothetical protein